MYEVSGQPRPEVVNLPLVPEPKHPCFMWMSFNCQLNRRKICRNSILFQGVSNKTECSLDPVKTGSSVRLNKITPKGEIKCGKSTFAEGTKTSLFWAGRMREPRAPYRG